MVACVRRRSMRRKGTSHRRWRASREGGSKVLRPLPGRGTPPGRVGSREGPGQPPKPSGEPPASLVLAINSLQTQGEQPDPGVEPVPLRGPVPTGSHGNPLLEPGARRFHSQVQHALDLAQTPVHITLYNERTNHRLFTWEGGLHSEVGGGAGLPVPEVSPPALASPRSSAALRLRRACKEGKQPQAKPETRARRVSSQVKEDPGSRETRAKDTEDSARDPAPPLKRLRRERPTATSN